MIIFKKIDGYLLRHFPNVWVTKIHIVTPIFILAFGLIFLANSFLISYNTKDPIPESVITITFISIAVVIGMVFWFIFQARHNVEKSGGNLNIGQEYLNFFTYLIIFLMGAYLISAVPLSDNYKVGHSVTSAELNEDIANINAIGTLVNGSKTLDAIEGSSNYTFYRSHIIDQYDTETGDRINNNSKQITISQSELIAAIKNYIHSYDKYTTSPIEEHADEIFLRITQQNGAHDEYHDYYQTGRYYWGGPIHKIEIISRIKTNNYHSFSNEKEFHYILLSFAGLFALFVWIFKQMHWKYYMYGLIALAIVPMLVGIISVTAYEVSRIRPDDFLSHLMLIGYIITSILIIKAYVSDTLNHTSIVIALFLQLYIPFLPITLFSLYEYNELYQYHDNLEEILFYSAWALTLVSLPLFKVFYRRTRQLPAKK